MGNLPDTQGLPIEMAKVFSITPFNFPCSLLPSDGSVDTTYYLKLTKAQVIWLAWKVKEFHVSDFSYSGMPGFSGIFPAGSYGRSGTFDAFTVSNSAQFTIDRIGDSYPYQSERDIAARGAQIWTANPSKNIGTPSENTYGYQTTVSCSVQWTFRGYGIPVTGISPICYRDVTNNCYWVRPPDFRFYSFEAYGEGDYGSWGVRTSFAPNEISSSIQVGTLKLSLTGVTPISLPLIPNELMPGQLPINYLTESVSTISMSDSDTYPYSGDMNDF